MGGGRLATGVRGSLWEAMRFETGLRRREGRGWVELEVELRAVKWDWDWDWGWGLGFWPLIEGG